MKVAGKSKIGLDTSALMRMGVIPVSGSPVLYLEVILVLFARVYLIGGMSIIFKVHVQPVPVGDGWLVSAFLS